MSVSNQVPTLSIPFYISAKVTRAISMFGFSLFMGSRHLSFISVGVWQNDPNLLGGLLGLRFKSCG